MLTKKDIRKNLATMTPEERKAARPLLEKLNINLAEGDHTLTGSKPRGFMLEGRFYPADNHREIFLKVCEIAAAKNRDRLQLFFEMKGRTRRYFSMNHKDLSSTDYRKINGTSIYAELNESASGLNKRSEQVIEKFGMDLTTFKVFL
jgi:hypothetical protein